MNAHRIAVMRGTPVKTSSNEAIARGSIHRLPESFNVNAKHGGRAWASVVRSVCFLAWCMWSVVGLSGCKESPRKPVVRQSVRTSDVMQKTSGLDRLLGEASSTTEETPSHVEHGSGHEVKSIDVWSALESKEAVELVPTARKPLSLFVSEEERKHVRVSFSIRGIARGSGSDVEDRFWELLTSRAPDPWELHRATASERQDVPDVRMQLNFRRQVTRLRRIVKTAPPRVAYRYEVKIAFVGKDSLKSSWSDWTFEWTDEATSASENAVEERFWSELGKRLPALVVVEPEATMSWLRAHGRMVQVLTGELSGLRLSRHAYFGQGCVTEAQKAGGVALRSLFFPHTPPQNLDVVKIEDMACTRHGVYILSYEMPTRLALYHQTFGASHAWKTPLSFVDPVPQGGGRLHLDDDVLCAWSTGKTLEVQCFDRKTGLPRWKTTPLPGTWRGMAHDGRQLVFANDQAVLALSRHGELLDVQRLETRRNARLTLTCQLQNRLILTTAPGVLVSYHLDKHEFDWTMTTLDPSFVHCSKQNTLLVSDAGGYLLAMDVEHDTPMWRIRTVKPPLDMLTFGNEVYVLLERAILVVDRASGARVAQIPLLWRATRFIQNGSQIYLDTAEAIYRW